MKRVKHSGKFHDSEIVPATLLVLVEMHQFMLRLDHEEIEQYQTALPYSESIALLPTAKESDRGQSHARIAILQL